MILTLFGPPGSGKGTQAAFLSEKFGLAHLSTGDLLRAQRNADTPLARRMRDIMNRGELVPDDVVRQLVKDEAAKVLARRGAGILLDGYPRNVSQLRDLDALLNELKTGIDLGIHLDLEDGMLIRRLTARRVCESCQRPFNLISHPPKQPGICDACGGKLLQRGDDREQAIERRLDEYHRQTEPMLDELRKRRKLESIMADGPIEEIRDKLYSLIESPEDRSRRGVPVG